MAGAVFGALRGFVYSALASFRMGMSGSASFQSAKKSVNRSSEDQEVYDARYAWKISPIKARKFDYVLAVRRSLIIGAFKAREWLPATREHFPSLFSSREGYGPREGRYGFHGEAAPDDVKGLYLHKRIPDALLRRGAANPIRYVTV
jgi:uncharacterized protein